MYADPIQVERLWYDVQQVLDGTFDTFYRVFIKMEPHKIKKCQDKRWRLIIAAPLSVQIAWHMLFDYGNDVEIANSFELPSQQGLKVIGGDWKRYLAMWKAKSLVSSLDKSAWDWTAPYWAILTDLRLRFRLARGNQKQQWFEVAQRLYDDMFKHPKVVTTEGYVLRQVHPGIMKSGCVNTISTNSHCQVFLHLAVMLRLGENYYPLPACLGDDTLNAPWHVENHHLEAYRELGVQVKTVNDVIEFAGHTFKSTGPLPTYKNKHLMRFLYQEDSVLEEYTNGMMRMYVHDDDMYAFWERMNHALGFTPQNSKEYIRYWYDVSD